MNYQKLTTEFVYDLEKIEKSHQHLFSRIQASITLCKNTLSLLRQEVNKNGFNKVTDEIKFFKDIKVIPLSKLIYYRELGNIEYNFPRFIINEQKKFIKLQFKRLQYFFNSNIDFGQYIELKCTHLDHYYFTRATNKEPLFTNYAMVYLDDSNFHTPNDVLLGQFKAYEKLVIYLRNRLKKLSKANVIDEKQVLKWTGNKIELIELIYAIKASGSLKDTISIREIADACEELFDIDLGNYYRKFIELRNRKLVERTRFIDKLKSNLLERMDNADE